MCNNNYQLMSYFGLALATRLVLAGVSGFTVLSILRKCISYVGQTNEHSDSDTPQTYSVQLPCMGGGGEFYSRQVF